MSGPAAEGAAYISNGLREHTNEKLTELDLGYNEIKDEGACAVAQVQSCAFELPLMCDCSQAFVLLTCSSAPTIPPICITHAESELHEQSLD